VVAIIYGYLQLVVYRNVGMEGGDCGKFVVPIA